MSDTGLPGAQEPLRFEREYVTGADYPVRVTNALYRYIYLRPARLARWIILLCLYGAILTLLILNPYADNRGFTIFVLFFAVIFVALMVAGYFRARAKLREQLPVGTIFSIGFKDETLTIRGPFASSEISYLAFTAASRQGDFVFLRMRSTRRISAYPGELFTAESFAWLSSKMVP